MASMEEYVKAYVEVKKKIAEADDTHAKSTKALHDLKARLEGYFDKFLTDNGLHNAQTPYGTVHWTNRTTASLDDPEGFLNFVRTTGKFELLDRRANVSAVRDYVEKNKTLPPGVHLNPHRAISVSAPSQAAKSKQK